MPLLAKSPLRLIRNSVFAALAIVMLPTSKAEEPNTLVLHPQPTGDGELQDNSKPWDDTVDSVNESGLGATLGSAYGSQRRIIIEFAIPPKSALDGKEITSAMFSVCSNEKGVSPVSVEAFVYFGEEADGVVDDADWDRGKSLGSWMVEGETVIPSGTRRWPGLDVTDIVQKAIESGGRFIGFRLVAADLVPETKKSVVIRTTEFGDNYPGYRPELKLKLH